MPERRAENRPEGSDRRSFPRPPLWLNLALLVLAMATFAWARHHRSEVRQKSARLFQPTPSYPQELNRIREELANLDVSREQLSRELEGRMDYVRSVEGEEFYVSIDTRSRKFQLRFGKDVVRETTVTVGEPRTIEANGKSWTFVPFKGALNIVEKSEGQPWTVPAWVYAMNAQPIPESLPTIPNGLGRYVLYLPNGYIIHSPPPPDSPLQGPKPGSFLVPEADLAAIWPRLSNKTRIYIF